MKGPSVTMRRSAGKMWLLGMTGIPMLILAVEYIWRPFGFLDKFGLWAYRGGDVEPFEIRDDILAAGLAIVGTLLILVSLKELIFPRKVAVATEEGLFIALLGPFKKPTAASWVQVTDLVHTDRSLIIEMNDRGALPDDPWGAVWIGPTSLELSTTMWEKNAETFIDEIAQLGLPTAARQLAAGVDPLDGFETWAQADNPPPPRHLPVQEPKPDKQSDPESESKSKSESESESEDETASTNDALAPGSDIQSPVSHRPIDLV